MPDDPPLGMAEVLCAEFAALPHPDTVSHPTGLDDYRRKVLDLPGPGRTALCLSGGGIRSAAFAFGVVQALAQRGTLGKFDYLSTVSGGGYLGGFLTAWLHRAGWQTVIKDLGPRQENKADEQDLEPKPLQWLRANQKFVTPQLGLGSPDTWTVAATIVRNLLLNWVVFLPLIFGLLLLPKIFQELGAFIAPQSVDSSLLYLSTFGHAARPSWVGALDTVAAACIVFGFYTSAKNRPRAGGAGFDARKYKTQVLLPALVGAALLSLEAGAWLKLSSGHFTQFLDWAGIGGLLYGLSYSLAAWSLRSQPEEEKRRRFPIELIAWISSGILAGTLAWAGLTTMQWLRTQGTPGILALWMVAGVPWIILSFLVGEVLYVGLTSRLPSGDQDREWLARAAGYFGAAAIAWAVVVGLVLYANDLEKLGNHYLVKYLAGGTGLATIFGALSSYTAATAKGAALSRVPLTLTVSLVCGVFILCIIVLIAHVSPMVLHGVHGAVPQLPTVLSPLEQMALLALAAGLLIGFSEAAAWFVNVNWFSLHAFYRNRLVKAFLGASNEAEHANRNKFDGFSETDNLKVGDIRIRGTGALAPLNTGLFPVFNMTLNITHGENEIWSERKAMPFVATPLHTGGEKVAFRPSLDYMANGIRLGTVMAISGAAASPNWGYHSSPMTRFVMMLFNVRLGCWLGNPRMPLKQGKAPWRLDGPQSSLRIFLQEAFGMVSDEEPFVYLSDGGHFENLGLYEMVRRRCRTILVSDASCDPDCSMEDLGNALRRIYVDFGVKVEFDKIDLAARKDPPVLGAYCAVGTVIYPEAPSKPGTLLYIKPGIYGTEPADVRAYAAGNAAFPHDSTADQWFTEAQFESYRALGAHVVETIGKHELSAAGDLQSFFVAARTYLSTLRG